MKKLLNLHDLCSLLMNFSIHPQVYRARLITGLLLVFLHAGSWVAGAQQKPFLFKHLTVEDGLSNDNIRIIYQDKMGFMWFGTDLGLNRYDGSEITIYQRDFNDPGSIASNMITSIFEDSHGVFWVGTMGNGLCRFDRQNEFFYNYQLEYANDSSLSNNLVRSIFEDSRNNLWIGTAGGGLNLYNRESDCFTRFMTDSSGGVNIGTNYISSIAEDRDGYLWLGTQVGLLVRYDVKLNKSKIIQLGGNFKNDITSSIFSKIYIDSDNNIWVCSEDGLFYYDQRRDILKHFKKGNTNRDLNAQGVTSILEYQKGIYLIATDHGGLNVLDMATGRFTYLMSSKLDETTLSNNQLQYIYRSPDNIIWIGCYRGGINILDPLAIKFIQYRNLVNEPEKIGSSYSVLSICEDPDKNIWFGKDGQGIDIFNPSTCSVRHLRADGTPNSIPGDIITDIFKDSQGNMWIGTYQSGLSKFDWETKKFTHFRHDPDDPGSLALDDVWAILVDREGTLWVGTFGGGLDRYDANSNTFRHFIVDPFDTTKLVDRFVMDILEDSKGHLWIATRNGLSLYNRETDTFSRYIYGQGGGYVIYDIFEDFKGNLWVGTDFSLQLIHPETNTIEVFNRENGLAGTAVYSVLCDQGGKIWISSNKGLSCFDPSSKRFKNFPASDGLQNREFNYTSGFRSSSGFLYFGGKNGVNLFLPDNVQENTRLPQIYFTGVKVLNHRLGPREKNSILTGHIFFAKKLVFNHNQNIFTVSFSALNYTNPRNNQYAAMLDGFDKSWVQLGNRNEVTYTNLNPGRYVLRVKASNNDGIWNDKGISLDIQMLPPWWKTVWFQILILSLFTGLLVLIYYIRVKFIRKQQVKLVKLVKERTRQLEEVALSLEEKQEEINTQNEELTAQRDELSTTNLVLVEQKQMILDQNRELDKHRSNLEVVVEERTRDLIQAKEKAEESDRLKSSFLANLSHEIRTPLNAILGFSILLSDNDLNKDERERFNHIIYDSSNTLLDLINDILDISKIEASQLELEMRDVLLESLVNDLVEVFDLFMKRADLGSGKPVQLRVSIPDEILHSRIITDKLRLKQIISNLLSNAIKFTREGYIELGCRRITNPDMLEFHVKDTGIGIKEEYQQLIFHRFRKIEEDKTYLHRGLGLGLAISSQLVTMMGGTISVTSKPGEGSVFHFTIPLREAGSPPVAVLKEEPKVESIPSLEAISVLIAEDDISNFQYLEKLLNKSNAKVLHAWNGREVMLMLNNDPGVNIILMDIKMPIMDGIEALRELRRMNVNIPVIAQTAYTLAEEVMKLKNEGFDDYISKPIQPEHLYAILTKYLVIS